MQTLRCLKVALLVLVFSVSVYAQESGEPGEAASGAGGGRRSDNTHWIFTHGVLMSIGWVALLPSGVLLAQSRWQRPVQKKVASKQAWFWIHVALQVTGAALIIAAIGIAYSPSTHMEPDKDETLAYTHKVIGTIAFSFLLLQIVAALIRPKPDAAKRGIWNHIHHNTGRLAILLGWVNIWLGVVVWHIGRNRRGTEITNGYLAWVVPLAVFQGLAFIAYILGMFAATATKRSSTPTYKQQGEAQQFAVASSPAGAV